MRIAFLCGSLEPGKDGVGDYVRRLAGALSHLGHRVAALGMNDSHLTDRKETSETLETSETAENSVLRILRLPSGWTQARRFQEAGDWLREFDPEWLSLQFVPFAYQPKGLFFGVEKELRRLTKTCQCHVMFHELWVGMRDDSTWRMILWGWLQRQLIRSLLRGLRPRLIQTQTLLYVDQLQKCGFPANHLPLFGNIPPLHRKPNPLPPLDCLHFIHFGTIYPDAPLDLFVAEVVKYAREQQLPARLTLIGRSGSEQEKWIETWEKAGLPVEVLGEQSPAAVSRAMTAASIGIVTTAYALIGKSGSAAALLEHGLPVLCVAREWLARGIKAPLPFPDASEYFPGNLAHFLQNLCSPNRIVSLASVAAQLSDAFQNAAQTS